MDALEMKIKCTSTQELIVSRSPQFDAAKEIHGDICRSKKSYFNDIMFGNFFVKLNP